MYKYISVLFTTCIAITHVACNSSASASINATETTTAEQKKEDYILLKQYPHNTANFTEGLAFYNNDLYESTGDGDYTGKSKIAIIDTLTGNDKKNNYIGKNYFGEGFTIINNKAYMYTWQNQKGFVFDATTLKKIKEFSYTGEGWGMTNNGQQIITSNGSNNICFRNAETFAEEKTVAIFDENGPVANINELEYVDGVIYFNQWQTNYIYKIEANSGKLLNKYNLSALVQQYIPTQLQIEMNGIAYNKNKKTFLITGKNWPTMFEIKFN